jgi:hypothetical protein
MLLLLYHLVLVPKEGNIIFISNKWQNPNAKMFVSELIWVKLFDTPHAKWRKNYSSIIMNAPFLHSWKPNRLNGTILDIYFQLNPKNSWCTQQKIDRVSPCEF